MTEAMGSPNRPRVLIVGAGRRVQNNFLPALRCMEDALSLVGIHSRTAERLLPVADRWNVRAFPEFEEIDMSAVDVVAISVPTPQNAIVLKRLEPFAARLTLVIDTPIASSRRELAASYPSLIKFKRILAAEDYMNFPPFALLRQAVQDGLIGSLQGTTLFNIGFMYHGLALIRSFNGFKRARRTWTRSVGAFSRIVGYSFAGGYQAVVVGPYRSHTTGGITLSGDKGVITDFPQDVKIGNGGDRPVFLLSTHRADDGLIAGFSIDGAQKQYQLDLPALRQMAEMDFSDKSDLNLLRGCGLISVFKALYEPGNLNNTYGVFNALYDSFLPRIAQRGLLPFDPLVPFGGDAVKLIRLLSRG